MSCNTGSCSIPMPQLGGRYIITRKQHYCATRKNMNTLRKYKQGKTIGFTSRSSLRSKGLLPRVGRKYQGKYVLGSKYSTTHKNTILHGRTKKCRRT